LARLADLPLKYRIFMTAYRYRRLSPCPFVPFGPGSGAPPLSKCRVALVTTAAFYLPDQEPFDEELRGGDYSYRVIPTREADLTRLRIGHRSEAFDHAGIESDFNLALPVDRFRELEREGVIGELHGEALSFMGSVTAPGRLIKLTAPEAATRIKDAGVQVAFLCPV
jgi:D-proline reductase (dithiol) PrdB